MAKAAPSTTSPRAWRANGGGTDGSVGIKDVKELGGVIMVQDPTEAEFDSMRLTAINTGGSAYLERYRRCPADPGQLPASALLMLSGHMGQNYVKRSLAVGARGYLLKDDVNSIREAIHRALDGENYLSPSVRKYG